MDCPIVDPRALIQVTTGDHKEIMQRVVDHLTAAQKYAANENQVAMLQEYVVCNLCTSLVGTAALDTLSSFPRFDRYVKCFGSGDMQAHIAGSRHWIKDKGPAVESYIGFIESYVLKVFVCEERIGVSRKLFVVAPATKIRSEFAANGKDSAPL